MKPTSGRITAVGALAVAAGMAMFLAGADAHHPEINASVACVQGKAEVRFEVFSWVTAEPAHRYNSNVVVSFDGVQVGAGAFLPSNNYAFTIVHPTTPDGAQHVLRATAVTAFGPNGEFGNTGEFRETTVTLPQACAAPTTTTAAPTTTAGSGSGSPTTTTTTAGSGGGGGGGGSEGSGAETPTTIPIIVGGAVETRPGAAIPVVALPRFAG